MGLGVQSLATCDRCTNRLVRERARETARVRAFCLTVCSVAVRGTGVPASKKMRVPSVLS